MKLLIVFSLGAWMVCAADGQTKKDPAPEAAAVSVPAATGPQLPDGAVKAADGSYRYTDPQGKKWIFRKTPFGMARFEDKPLDVSTRAESAKRYEDVKATEDGDTVRFERPGPFGIYKWQRKKTELNEMEQTVWSREQSRIAAK
jgi:hypothetical protein